MSERYGYATVETALATVFGIDAAAQKGALRSRLKHIQQLGLPSEGPGKGRRISYTPDQIYAWLIVLELAEFGIDPRLAVKMVKTRWDCLADAVQAARDADHDIALAVRPRFMSGDPRLDPGFGRIELTNEVLAAQGSYLAKPGKRLCIFNLSSRLRELDTALQKEVP
jgi:hypothetical protein